MSALGVQRSGERIFISCAEDSRSLPILHALVFTSRICGFQPSHRSLGATAGETEALQAVHGLLTEARLSVHDISPVSDGPDDEAVNSSAHFELGMALALPTADKRVLVIEREHNDRLLSLLQGKDIGAHGGDPRRASGLLRRWLATAARGPLPSAPSIWKAYRRFLADLPELAAAMAGRRADSLPLRDWNHILSSWLLDEAEPLSRPAAEEQRGEAAASSAGPSEAEDGPSGPVSSSQWTGIRPLREQVAIVRGIAPLAQKSLEQLIEALEEKRYNDPATGEALDALRALHAALGELIARAEADLPMRDLFASIERHKERLGSAIREGAQVMVTAPALAVGASYMLSLLSGFPVSDAMLSTLCATMMGKDALLALAGRGPKRSGPSPP